MWPHCGRVCRDPSESEWFIFALKSDVFAIKLHDIIGDTDIISNGRMSITGYLPNTVIEEWNHLYFPT